MLEAELTDRTDRGRIPRPMLGRHLQWLQFFAEGWVGRHLASLFPDDDLSALLVFPGHARMHFGYYDESVKSHEAALLKMNEVLADIASIVDGEHVLDAGCGYVGSSIWLAKNRNCRVTGISLVAEQVNAAIRFAEEHGVADRVELFELDYNATALPDAFLDVNWSVESLMHSDKKQAFSGRPTVCCVPVVAC